MIGQWDDDLRRFESWDKWINMKIFWKIDLLKIEFLLEFRLIFDWFWRGLRVLCVFDEAKKIQDYRVCLQFLVGFPVIHTRSRNDLPHSRFSRRTTRCASSHNLCWVKCRKLHSTNLNHNDWVADPAECGCEHAGTPEGQDACSRQVQHKCLQNCWQSRFWVPFLDLHSYREMKPP